MHVIFKLRIGVTGPEYISADDVDASPPRDGTYQRTGGGTLRKSNVCDICEKVIWSWTRGILWSNTAWCGSFFCPMRITAAQSHVVGPREMVAWGEGTYSVCWSDDRVILDLRHKH